MIRQWWTVFRKEIIDNVRDRRTLLTVLVFGPLFGPLFYVGLMSAIINHQIADRDQPLDLPVAHAERAPNLVEYLKANNVVIKPAPADLREAVKKARVDVVLKIPAGFSDAFRDGSPAPLQVVMDKSKDSAQKSINRLRDLLNGYNRQLGALRLLARGVAPTAVSPLAIEEVDVSTPQSRAAMIMSMVPYFFLFAAIIGAYYLAIDSTAGERERGSLEPLLTTAVSRGALALGKIGAVTVFSAITLGLDVLALYASQGVIPAEKLNVAMNFTPAVAGMTFLVTLPFCLLIAALLSVVASFTRSYKEAQTWLSFIFIIPMVPVFGLMLFPAQPQWWMMLVPSLSQDVIVTSLMKGEALRAGFMAVSIAATLVVAAALSWLAAHLYNRERLLG